MKYTKLSYRTALSPAAERRLRSYLSKLANRRFRHNSKIDLHKHREIQPVSIKGIYD